MIDLIEKLILNDLVFVLFFRNLEPIPSPNPFTFFVTVNTHQICL